MSPLFSSRPWLQHDPAIQLGWDHAHHGIRPSLDSLASSIPLKQGYQAGLAVFARRTLKLTPFVKPWLDLRLEALERGRFFDAEQVNPRYIQQLAGSHCPVTRQPLAIGADDTVIVRLRPDLEYVAGNLVMMGRSAWLSSGRSPMGSRLDVADKARLDVLASFANPLSHAEASKIPLLVMPPNRLRVRNPVQALQAVASRLLATSDARFEKIRLSIPGGTGRVDIDAFANAFSTELMAISVTSNKQARPASWAIEDAWQSVDVQQRWQQVASHLDAVDAERIVSRLGTAARSSAGFLVVVTADDDVLPPLQAARAIRLLA